MSSEVSPPSSVPIAIVGVTAIMPGATDVDAFWRNVVAGHDLVTDVPADRWLLADYYDPEPTAEDKTYGSRGAFLPEVAFDPMRFGISPRNIATTDSAQLLTVLAADRILSAMEDLDGERVSVFLGTAATQLLGEMAGRIGRPVWEKVLRAGGIPQPRAQQISEEILSYSPPWQESTFPGMLSNVIAGRVANRFDLHGTNFTVDAACASSLAALSVAVDELTLGRADLVLTGGVDTLNDPMSFISFSKTPALSPTGDCRPFSDQADGMVLGEGLGLFALKRLADAEADDDAVHAVITGIGSSSDGSGTSIYAPTESGQQRALRRAYAAAGYDPQTVGLLEAHGTGTATGDPTEIAALRPVFADPSRSHWCAIGSVKSQIGHTKSAAGAAGLLKATLALQHRVLPPTIKVERPHPDLAVDDSPFYVNTRSRPWFGDQHHPRRAAVSSFGFGGTNFHVTLEEYRPGAGRRRPPTATARPTELVLASAESPEALVASCRQLAAEVDSLAYTAHQSQQAFDPHAPARLAVVAADPDDLVAKLGRAAEQIDTRPDGFDTPDGVHYAYGTEAGRIGFLFPGQGSQYTGMGADLAVHFPPAHDVWASATSVPGLTERVFPIPVFSEEDRARQRDALTATEWAQPAIAAHSRALLTMLDAVGVRPDGMAGHSFGELTALHAARSIDGDTLLRLARRRGELLRDAADDPGGMLAVEATPDQIVDHLAGRPVWITNANAPGQLVLSGTADGLTEVEKLLPPTITTRRLDTSAAFHSPLVASAADRLAEFLDTLQVRAPLHDVYGNADATRYPLTPDEIRATVAEQLAAPVQFADMITRMYADGVRTFVEVGPGRVLTGLVGKILDGRDHHAIATDQRDRHGVTSWHQALGRLAVLGVELSFEGLWHGIEIPRPSTAPAGGPPPMLINGANAGRRQPPEPTEPPGPGEPPQPDPTELDIAPTEPTHSMPAAPTGLPDHHPDRIEPPAQRLPHPPTGHPSSDDDQIVPAILEVHRQTARAHRDYLALAEQTIRALGGTSGSMPSTAPESTPPLPPADPTPRPVPAPFDGPTVGADLPEPQLSAGPTADPAPALTADPAPGQPVDADLEAAVLSVVADKTGYPVEVIGSDMELDADLGLDSITRAQVLAALRPMFPQLENLDRAMLSELATLRTVGEIAGRLRTLDAGAPDASAVEASTAAAPAQPRRQHVELVPAPRGTAVAAPQGRIAIIGEGRGVAAELVARLAEHGVDATVQDTVPPDADGVVFLDGLARIETPDQAWEIQAAAFRAARAVAPRLTRTGGLFATVQDTGGFGLRHADPTRCWLGGLAGLARTADWEWPYATTQAIDCATEGRSTAEVAAAIADELLDADAPSDVHLAADGSRWTLAGTVAEPSGSSPLALGDQPVLLVSGGARGITAAGIIALAQQQRATFVLCGRTAEAPADTVAALEAAGSRVRYLGIDVRDRQRLATELARVREEDGPITGLIHGAGVLADRRIEHKTDDQFHQVFSTKTVGLEALLAETRQDPLRLIVGFSSITSLNGWLGQCDYAMANETLNHVLAAERAARPDSVVRSLIWGPWQGGMVTPEVEETFALAGVHSMPFDAGVRAFVDELNTPSADPRVIWSIDPLRKTSDAGR